MRSILRLLMRRKLAAPSGVSLSVLRANLNSSGVMDSYRFIWFAHIKLEANTERNSGCYTPGISRREHTAGRYQYPVAYLLQRDDGHAVGERAEHRAIGCEAEVQAIRANVDHQRAAVRISARRVIAKNPAERRRVVDRRIVDRRPWRWRRHRRGLFDWRGQGWRQRHRHDRRRHQERRNPGEARSWAIQVATTWRHTRRTVHVDEPLRCGGLYES